MHFLSTTIMDENDLRKLDYFISIINKMPTDFDVDEVIERLKEKYNYWYEKGTFIELTKQDNKEFIIPEYRAFARGK